MPRPIDKTLSPAAASTTNICQAQTTAGAANLLLNGTTAGSLDYGSLLVFHSTGDIHTVTFTVTGTDPEGNAQSDTVTNINNSYVLTTKYFLTVSSIAADGAVGTNVTVGTGNSTRVLASRYSALDFYCIKPPRIEITVTGTVNYTVQETFDDMSSLTSQTAAWYDVAGLDRITTSKYGEGSLNATALRVIINSTSSTPTVEYRVIQSGNGDED